MVCLLLYQAAFTAAHCKRGLRKAGEHDQDGYNYGVNVIRLNNPASVFSGHQDQVT